MEKHREAKGEVKKKRGQREEQKRKASSTICVVEMRFESWLDGVDG